MRFVAARIWESDFYNRTDHLYQAAWGIRTISCDSADRTVVLDDTMNHNLGPAEPDLIIIVHVSYNATQRA